MQRQRASNHWGDRLSEVELETFAFAARRALPASSEGEAEGGRPGWRRWQEQRNELEILTFDRGEVNAKALRRLRRVLTEEQIARIRLPEEEPDEG